MSKLAYVGIRELRTFVFHPKSKSVTIEWDAAVVDCHVAINGDWHNGGVFLAGMADTGRQKAYKARFSAYNHILITTAKYSQGDTCAN